MAENLYPAPHAELFPGLPETALVTDQRIMEDVFPGKSHMFLWRARQRGSFPTPIKLPNSNRNHTPVSTIRRWYRNVLGQQEAA